MFWPFRKSKHNDVPEEAKKLAKQWLGPVALLAAVASICREYASAVKAGKVEYPAYNRRRDGVLAVWQDIRIEALLNLFYFGVPDGKALTDPPSQLSTLNCLLDERPHLEMPQPRGEQPADTIQALFRVYVYLDEAGTAVCDGDTDQLSLRLQGKNIFSNFEERARQLREEWKAYRQAMKGHSFDLLDAPKTIFEILYEDVTRKAKGIALSARFGPDYRVGMLYLIDIVTAELRQRGASEQEIQNERAKSESA